MNFFPIETERLILAIFKGEWDEEFVYAIFEDEWRAARKAN